MQQLFLEMTSLKCLGAFVLFAAAAANFYRVSRDHGVWNQIVSAACGLGGAVIR